MPAHPGAAVRDCRGSFVTPGLVDAHVHFPQLRIIGALGRSQAGMRHSHFFGACGMTQLLIGFVIALAVGLTGIGGGSFTVPALLLFAGLPAGEAVGTAFVFAGFVRLVAAPFYLFSRQIHSRYFWLLLRGAVPGLLSGTLVLRFVTARGGNSTVVILLGVVLALTAALHLAPRARKPAAVNRCSRSASSRSISASGS